MVVERAFATSSNATVCTHIGLPPSRIATATSSPSGPVVSGSTTTSAPSSRARSAIVEASGTSPRVFQLSTVTDAASPATSDPPTPRAAMTATFPAAKSASTTAMAMPNARVARGNAKNANATAATRAHAAADPRSATMWAATHWFCSPKPWGHSRTAAMRAVPSTTAQPRMRGSIPSTIGPRPRSDAARRRRSAGSRR